MHLPTQYLSALQYIALGTDIMNSALLDIGIVCIPKSILGLSSGIWLSYLENWHFEVSPLRFIR